jgi:formate hydrogenlyase subunit 4
MTGAELLTGGIMLAALVAAPLVPGLIQQHKARLQGRVGAGALQPYRDLRRLWRKAVVQPAGTSVVYVLAPAVCAAALLAALLITPAGPAAPPFGVGHDALVLVGVLALARCAVALSAWDTRGAFGLMGAARDLTFAVLGEALVALVLLTAALPVASTDLRAMWIGAADARIWTAPAHWCGLAGMVLIVMLETGRQPIDNPDTHLELTMVHEGPLLEYAGRDLAYLQWSAAARHWIVLVLMAGLFLPHPAGAVTGLGVVLGWVLVLTVALALIETWRAKLRLLVVPQLTAAVCAVALLGITTWVIGIGR